MENLDERVEGIRGELKKLTVINSLLILLDGVVQAVLGQRLFDIGCGVG